MRNSFKCYIDSATVQKKQFEKSVDSVRDSLAKVIMESSSTDFKNQISLQEAKPTYSTGWLRGALSYPWAFVSITIPSFLENIF